MFRSAADSSVNYLRYPVQSAVTPVYHGVMVDIELYKMCAVIPRHLGKGAKKPPPLHPPLAAPPYCGAGTVPPVQHGSASCLLDIRGTTRDLPATRGKWEIALSPLNPIPRMENSFSLRPPIDQDRETSSLPLDRPIGHRFAVGARPGLARPRPTHGRHLPGGSHGR